MVDENAAQTGANPGAVMNEVAGIMQHLIGVLMQPIGVHNVHQAILREVFEDKARIEKARTNLARHMEDPKRVGADRPGPDPALPRPRRGQNPGAVMNEIAGIMQHLIAALLEPPSGPSGQNVHLAILIKTRSLTISLFRKACKFGLEGLVSKRADRPYRAGRSPDWTKVKKRRHPPSAGCRISPKPAGGMRFSGRRNPD